MSENDNSTILAFLLGGVIGAGVALLLSPWSGREIREKVKGSVWDTKEKAEEYISQSKERVTSLVEKGKETLEKEKLNLLAAIEAGKEAYRKEKSKIDREGPAESQPSELSTPG